MDTPATRNEKGHFQPGCPPGPGRPPGRSNLLQRAAEEAVTPEHVTAIMRRALRSALEGNLSAARFVIERACGKALEARIEALPLDIASPRLRTAADCTAAIQKLTDAICRGTLDIVHGKVLLDAIAVPAKLIETRELEARLAELERQASVVDFQARR